MFASERHNFITSPSGGSRTRRTWAILTLFALLAGYIVAIVTPPVPARAEFTFDCSSTEGYAYFVNSNSGSVSAVYTGTDTNVRNVTVGGTPYGLASLPNGSAVYVANGNGTVQRIDTATMAVTTITSPTFSTPVGAWSSADGSQVYISNYGTNTVSVIDTATNTVSRVITVGGTASRPGWTDANGNELFVAMDNTTGGIAVIDMNSGSTTASRVIAGAAPAHTVAVNTAFVASAAQTTSIQIHNTAAPSALVRTITAPENIHGLTFVPGTNYLVATSAAGHTYVYDASTGALLRTFVAGGSNMRIAVASPIGNEVYIAGVDGAAGTIDRLVTVGPPASWTYTTDQTSLQALPDGHTPAFSCLPPLTGAKSFAKSPIAMGETTLLTITITNPNIAPTPALTGVALTDDLPSNIRVAASPAPTTTCTGGTVTAAAGSGTVALTGASVPAASGPNGSIVNGSCQITVPVIGIAPGAQTNTIPAGNLSADVVGPSTTPFSAPIEVLAPGLAITKANDDADGIVEGGQTLTYTLTVTNSGTIAQTGLTVDDVLPPGVTYARESTVVTQGTTTRDNAPGGANPDLVGGDPVTGTLVGPTDPFTIPPGQTMTVRYQVTVDAPAPATVDSYTNTASVSSAQEPTPIETSNTVEGLSALQLDKQAGTPVDVNGNGSVDAGDTIAYTFTVTNTGNVAVNDLTVSDPKVGAVTCDVTSLAPTEVATCTAAPYEITQAETDAGEVANTATASGVDPGGDPVPSNESSTTTPTDQTTELTFDKTAGTPVDTNGDGLVDAGDTIAYTFTVTNTGTVTVADVAVDDPKLGTVTCDVTTLAPAAVATCTAAPYTITAADQDAGSVDNTASASGTDPAGDAVTSDDDATSTPVVAPAPALEFEKTAGTPVDLNGNGVTDAGDTIAYTFTVTNTGNVTVTDVAVSDPKVGPVTCDVTSLAPTEVATCTAAPYAIAQADVDAGEIENTASASGTDPAGDPVPSNDDSTTTPTDQNPSLEFDKTAGTPVDVNANGLTDEGDTIAYTFTVTNTGTVTVDGIAVADDVVGAVTCDVTTLAPGAVATCTAGPYAITAADEAAGEVVNTASASGTGPGGDPVPSNEDSTTTPVVPSAPALTIDKVAGDPVDVNGNGITDLGDTIAYTFTVTNTGNVPLADVAVDDPKVGAVTCDVTTLAPGAVATCAAAPYVITQADVDNGSVDNSATATGTPPGEPAVPSEPDTTTTPTDPSPALTLEKTAGAPVDVNANGLTDAGDTIAFTFTVTNTGNVTMTDVVVDDPKVGAVTCDVTTLAPGEVATCAAEPYVITAADQDAGSVDNTATASGTDPAGDTVPSNEDSTSTPVVAPAPALTLEKTAGAPVDVNANGITDAGDTIAFTFTVTNAGNVTMTDVAVDDPKVGPVTCDVTTLAPGEVATCAAEPYVITAADQDAGSVDNTATASGTDPAGDTVPSNEDSTSTPAEASAPSLTLDKSAGDPVDVNGNGVTDLGDTIVYTFTVTNTGNVPLADIAVNDPKVGAVICDTTTLAPGAVATCTSDPYAITQADVDNGSVDNSATASGTPPGEPAVPSEPDTTTTPTDRSPALTLEKTAGAPVDVNANGITDAGDTIAFTFTVTNTGNVTMTDIAVDDPKVGAVTCDVTSLAPAAVATCTAAAYTVTADDEAAGAVDNTATASGTDPAGDTVPSNEDSTTTPVEPSAPSLLFEKTAGTPVDVDGDGLTDAGDTIAYTFTVTNTGNVPVADVTVTDPKLGPVTCDVTSLAPGEVASCTAAPYTITQAEADAGSVENTATAAGTPPGEPAVPSNPDTTNTPVDQAPQLLFDKTAGTPVDVNANGLTDAGDTIAYTFTVTNTGNVTVTDIVVTDPKVGVVVCDVTTLAPGEVASCSAEPYTITADDETAGQAENTAAGAGSSPGGDRVPSNDDTTDTPVVPSAPALTFEKSAGTPADVNGNGLTDVGDTIVYTFTATNTGNVPLSDVTVDDPKVGAVICDATTLAVGETATCTSEPYAITQADLDAGAVKNTATATGTPPGGPAVPSNPSTTTTPTDQQPSLALVKTGVLDDGDRDDIADAGEVIHYGFRITNTGNVTMSDIGVDDPLLDEAGEPISCPAAPLPPGESLDCSASHTVTAAEATGKALSNTATATGTPGDGEPIHSDPSTVETPTDIPPAPGPAHLPTTGGSVPLGWSAAALAFLLAGAGLFAIGRRRRRGHAV